MCQKEDTPHAIVTDTYGKEYVYIWIADVVNKTTL